MLLKSMALKVILSLLEWVSALDAIISIVASALQGYVSISLPTSSHSTFSYPDHSMLLTSPAIVVFLSFL